mgnify:CR=1 FL=1
MSKYIPGNQKHLTLEDRKYIEKSLNSQKKSGCTGSATGITKVVLTMHIIFASTDIIVEKSMYVARSFSVASNAPLVRPAIRHARTLLKNAADDSIKHLMCATDVQKQSITAQLPTNTAMILFLLIANTKNVSRNPEPV